MGTWRSHRLAGVDLGLVLTLHILADGSAELYTATGDGPAFVEKGTWRLQDRRVTVLVFEVDRPPSPNEMLLERRSDALVPLRWDVEFYGKSPLGSFQRLQGEELAR